MEAKRFESVDEYISAQAPETQALLRQIRRAVKEAAPHTEEVISYNMPAVKYHGVLVYYAARSRHIGFYPTGSGIKAFKEELNSYITSAGTVQFPLTEKIPITLVKNIVKFRVKENLERALRKKKKQ